MNSNLIAARRYLPLAMALLLPAVASANTTTVPDFGTTVPAQWAVDRYLPNSFALVNAFGKSNVLAIGINSNQDLPNRPVAYQSLFYNTQGEGFSENASSPLSMDAYLYVPSTWQDGVGNGWVRTDMWGEMADASHNAGVSYPIIGFTNTGLASSGRFRVWLDTTSTWLDLSSPVNYDSWNLLQMIFNGSSFQYFVNGTLAYTDLQIATSVSLDRVIMQAYNFGPSGGPDSSNFSWVSNANLNFTANWANAPEPGTIGSLGAGLLAMAAAGWKRRAARHRNVA